MLRHDFGQKWWVLCSATAVMTLAIGSIGPSTVRAAGLEEIDTSLRMIPADAAFYSSSLRGGEQIKIIGESRAWAKLLEMPAVQMGLGMYDAMAADPESPAAQAKAALANPQIQAILAFVGDMFSHDVFCYGDKDVAEFLELVQTAGNTMRFGPLLGELSEQAGDIDADELQARMLMGVLTENLDAVKAPNMIIGFKVSDPQTATIQVQMLSGMAAMATAAVPQLAGRVTQTPVGESSFLTISLDGEMVPWEELPLDEFREYEANEGDADKLIEHLKELTLVIGLGVRGDYILLSIGDSLDCLTELGSGDRLVDRPEFKPLEAYTGERLASIGYVSEDLMSALALGEEDVDELGKLADAILGQVDIDSSLKKQIGSDVEKLLEDIKAMIPAPGAVMSFSYLTNQGIEGYSYNWTESVGLDGSKPLGLLQHVGGDPILAATARWNCSVDHYNTAVKWCKVAHGYIEKFALPEMPKKDRKKVTQLMETLGPVIARLDKVNREKLIPAFADGQCALVIDAELTSRKFCKDMPKTKKPLPMIEPALVIGVSDAKLLREACAAYIKGCDEVLAALREIEPGKIPEEFDLPEAKISETDLGTIWAYPLPKELGVDKKIQPNVGLSEYVLAISASKEHTERLLTPTTPSLGLALADLDRPRAAGCSFNWARLVEAATPWVEWAVVENLGDSPETETILEQVRTGMEILQVIRTVSVETYLEDGVQVSHFMTEIRDIEE